MRLPGMDAWARRADQLRKEAERVRVIAATMQRALLRRELLDVARQYEIMAQMVEGMRRMAELLQRETSAGRPSDCR